MHPGPKKRINSCKKRKQRGPKANDDSALSSLVKDSIHHSDVNLDVDSETIVNREVDSLLLQSAIAGLDGN